MARKMCLFEPVKIDPSSSLSHDNCMQTMSEKELDQFINETSFVEGSELTQVVFDEKSIQLHFTGKSGFVWLTFSMKPGTPFIFFSRERVYLVANKKKPLSLFIKTHFVGEVLQLSRRQTELGRVIEFNFSESKKLQFFLVPGRINVVATVGDKQVSALKPKDLAEHQSQVVRSKGGEPRSNEYFRSLWQKSFENKKTLKVDQAIDLQKQMSKKQKALDKMREKLASLQKDQWKRAGVWLQQFTELPEVIPVEFREQLDVNQSYPWNLNNCFEQSKKSTAKIAGTTDRIQELEKQLEKLKRDGVETKKSVVSKSLLAQASVKGKTYQIGDNKLYVGRSGTENLSLLRKAKPWFLWLHIKDFPGAYGILERNKKAKVNQSELEDAGLKVIRQSLPKGVVGQYELIYAECRYVRPIKEAKSGQVTYSHEKVIGIKVN